MSKIIDPLAGLVCVALAAATPAVAVPPSTPEQAIRTLRDQDAAVLRVGEDVAVRSAEICHKTGWSAGMVVDQASRYGADYRAAAKAILGVANRPTITLVASGGAADRAGLRPRDIIVTLAGKTFPDAAPNRSVGGFDAARAFADQLDAAFQAGPAVLTIMRDGVPIRVELTPKRACRVRFDVRAGRKSGASSDGLYVQVSSALVSETQSDGELAAILAHELAHNILEHPQRRTGRGPKPKVRVTEVEADRLSVYLLDAAGYGITGAVSFWGRWGKANDLGIFSDRSHPGWRKRIATVEAEAKRIADLRAAGRPVTPPPDLLPPG